MKTTRETGWHREGLFYKTYRYVEFSRKGRIFTGIHHKSLFFITYHLIKLIHGEKFVADMAFGGSRHGEKK